MMMMMMMMMMEDDDDDGGGGGGGRRYAWLGVLYCILPHHHHTLREVTSICGVSDSRLKVS